MATIYLDHASVAFPVYNVHARSFKQHFIRLTTGGTVANHGQQYMVIQALRNLSLSIHNGDRVAIIGHNGAGKSTLLRLLARIYEPTTGYAHIQGSISPMLDIMQGIEAEFTGYENIMTRGIISGLSSQQIKKQINEIAEFSGLGDYLAMPIRTYSSGMKVRLAFSISTSIKPDILLIDEVFGAGDAEFMQKAREKMISLLQQSSIVVMATHSDELLQEFCNKALLLDNGTIKYFGDIDEAMHRYHHATESVS